MGIDPLLRVQLGDGAAVFMLGAEDEPGTVENVDVEVMAPDGSRWSATVMTLAEIGRIMDRWAVSGEGLGGRYFQCDDLLVVGAAGLPGMVEVLGRLLDSGDFREVLTRLPDTGQ
jgi:hypothetical protein